jgi:hypothetical protein
VLGVEVPDRERPAVEINEGPERSDLAMGPVQTDSERRPIPTGYVEVLEANTVGSYGRLAGPPLSEQLAPADPVDLAAIVPERGRSLEGSRQFRVEDGTQIR